ncbi:MAG: hypothetical protein HY315_08970 [Acidobacteria bacterium]|nr:hypothetical protein [Acidobacteriota bacterium]
MTPHYRAHFLLILPAGISLLAALWAGLSRLGWEIPLPSFSLPSQHGPLMVSGFVATLVGLERAAALRWRWAYLAPVSSGAGGLLLLAGVSNDVAQGLALAGSLVLVAIFAMLLQRQPSLFVAAMGAGAMLLVIGHLLWHPGQPLYESQVIPWWVGFLVLTIAGERLELSRILGLGRVKQAGFVAAIGVLVSGAALSLLVRDAGIRLAGAGLVAAALWLLRYDIVWRNARLGGLSRYMALSLIAGYFWLAAGGVLWLVFAHRFIPGPEYDAMLHSVFIGFVFSMIMGHAPIILPGVLGVLLPFRLEFYSHLGLLHFSLLLRIAGGLAGWIPAQRWGGVFNVAAVLLFLLNNARAARSAPAEPRSTKKS